MAEGEEAARRQGSVVEARDGFPLSVQTGGEVDAPALLLLQGQANSHEWWTDLRSAFEADWRTITFDYRGTGQSRGPVGPWTTASFAADATDVLDGLHVDHAAVYGTSMGGRIAQMLVAGHPERVGTLILACTSPGGPHAVERGSDIRRALARSTTADRLTLLRDLFYTADWPHVIEDSRLMGDRSMSALESAAHLRASDEHDAWHALPTIQCPTLVLHGEKDRMTPIVNARLLAARVPGASLQIHPSGRHGFFDEFSPDINASVLQFLRAQVVR